MITCNLYNHDDYALLPLPKNVFHELWYKVPNWLPYFAMSGTEINPIIPGGMNQVWFLKFNCTMASEGCIFCTNVDFHSMMLLWLINVIEFVEIWSVQ